MVIVYMDSRGWPNLNENDFSSTTRSSSEGDRAQKITEARII